MKVSLIITTYHVDKEMVALTEACIASLVNGRPDEVIVVDDCSPIFIGLPGVDKYIRREENGGFPKASNTGWAEATGDILILSNNDIEYTPGWMEAILKPLEMGFDISSVRISDTDGMETEDIITEGDRFGSLWAQKRIVYETLKGFDESFGIGTHEDLDMQKRAELEGFKVAKNHAVYVKHIARATMDKLYPDREDFVQGRQRYIDKWGVIE